MMIKSFQDIDAYRRAYEIALAVHKATLNFPSIEQYALADQMRRASKSVCANIAEGFARQHASTADFNAFWLFQPLPAMKCGFGWILQRI